MQDFEAWAHRADGKTDRKRCQKEEEEDGAGERVHKGSSYRWRGSIQCLDRPGWPGSPSSRCGSSSDRVWGRAARGSRDSTSSWSRPCGSLEPRSPARQKKKNVNHSTAFPQKPFPSAHVKHRWGISSMKKKKTNLNHILKGLQVNTPQMKPDTMVFTNLSCSTAREGPFVVVPWCWSGLAEGEGTLTSAFLRWGPRYKVTCVIGLSTHVSMPNFRYYTTFTLACAERLPNRSAVGVR